MPSERTRTIACGAVLVAIGLGTVMEARHHRLGTLTQMQAGYFPMILGVLLACLGLILLVQGLLEPRGLPAPPPRTGSTLEGYVAPDWRGIAAITGGVAAFVGFGAAFGLVPATFACVFIAALGDRTSSLRGAAVLAAILAAVAAVVFAYGLGIPFPIVQVPWE